MNPNESCIISLLHKYPKAIVHMKRQFIARKFGLVFGAGVSNSFKVTDWNELVENIASDSNVNGKDLFKEM